jgi:hypothetical protein
VVFSHTKAKECVFMTKRVTILLDDATLAELQRRGAETGATVSGQVKAAVKAWVAPQTPREEF